MKVLRTTMWSPDLVPTTAAMRGTDIRFPIEETTTDQPGMFLVHDVFEMPEGSIQDATFRALTRAENSAEQERYQAIAYYYWAKMLRMVSQGGVVMADKPAPLNRSEMEIVLRQLQRHPNYRDQTFAVTIKDGTILTMNKNGEIGEVDS